MPQDNPFWDFSLAAYGKPGVAAACLRLQDQAAADVNLLLYFCWAAAVRDDALDRTEVGEAVARTQAWREGVVAPLRAVRRRMKEGMAGPPPESVEALRAEVKRIELEAERMQQDLLYRLAAGGPRKAAGGAAARRRAEENIAVYLSLIDIPQSADVSRDCQVVISASLPD
jgi:uncharacterized protein (TIGR02444 family)